MKASETQPGDTLPDPDHPGEAFYTVLDPPMREASRVVVRVRFPDGGDGYRVFAGDPDVPLVRAADMGRSRP